MKNPYFSYSRLARYEQCPRSYRRHYIDKIPGSEAENLRFGKIAHRALQMLWKHLCEIKHVGAIPLEFAREYYDRAWSESWLVGVEWYAQGARMIDMFVARQGVFDYRNILAIEDKFEIKIGPYSVIGYIDRIDKVDEDTIEIIDYKTSRSLFDRDQMDSSLQMSIYEIASRTRWPWVKNVKLSYWMLRHDLLQRTDRTAEMLQDHARYIVALADMIEKDEEYRANLNPNCPWCEHRDTCGAYQVALAADCMFVATSDIDKITSEREALTLREKAIVARKKELDTMIKKQLEHKEEIVSGDHVYRMIKVTSLEHEPARAVDILSRVLGEDRDWVAGKILEVSNTALTDLLKKLAKTDKSTSLLAKAELDAFAKEKHSPRLWSKKVS